MKHHRFTNSTGSIIVRGTNSGGKYKSKLEREAFIRAYLGEDVASVALQQPCVTYTDTAGDSRRYTGDLLVSFHQRAKRRPLVVECKYARVLDSDPDLVAKLKRVRGALAERRHDFVIQTERDIRASDFRMMRFIFDHVNNDPHPGRQGIMDCMRTHKNLTLGEVIKAVSPSLLGQYALIPEVWRLVAHRELQVDFHENLDMSAKITLPSV